MSDTAARSAAAAPLDDSRWFYRGFYMPFARQLARYHRARVRGTPYPGPCIYVTHHGAGYLNLDLVVLCYELAWKPWAEGGARRTPLRIAAAESRIEKLLPGLPAVKLQVGVIDASEASCLAVLRRGEQLLLTPGGSREAQPSRDFYRLRWENRFGFARLALTTGVPIVPVAVTGGAAAHPGVALRRLSFWLPVPLPARLDVAIGEPLQVEARPERARDPALLEPLQREAWRRTQALYDELLGGAAP